MSTSSLQEAEKATEAEKIRKETILSGNPLLKLGNGAGHNSDFNVKRRSVFTNWLKILDLSPQSIRDILS